MHYKRFHLILSHCQREKMDDEKLDIDIDIDIYTITENTFHDPCKPLIMKMGVE